MSADNPMLQAEAAYASGHLEGMFETLEQAYASGIETGDTIAAAAAAARIAMHLLIDTGLVAPVRVWIKRAERLLEGGPTTPVHAWLGLARLYERFQSGEFAQAKLEAERAIELGIEHDEPSATAMARIGHARSHIFLGDIETGLRLLDEASVIATAGDVDPLTEGMIHCEIVCAWQGVGMHDVAELWTETMERFSHGHAIGSVNGRCRIHRAELLRLRGRCEEAEKEALAACEELRPYMRREYGWPLTELGMIRLRMGDLDGAEEAFLDAHEKGWEPQPGLALLRLAQGDVTAAASLIRDALERPLGHLSKELPPNNELRRAPLLEAQVEIAIADGAIETARAASDELAQIAATYKSNALQASAALASGRVLLAEGNSSEAMHAFRTAVHLWSEISAPYETALARLGLAEVYRADGFEEGAELESRAARHALDKIGASRTSVAPRVESEPGGPNRFERDGDFWTITFDGKTTLIKDMKGLRYLERLLADPGREFHVVDLVALERGDAVDRTAAVDREAPSSVEGDAGAFLDEQAKAAYRRRLAEIDEDIEEARAFGDTERITRAGSEREFIVRELSHAVGMGGRDRRAGVTSERARAAVTRALRNALKKIGDHHPALADHLNHTIDTGTYCSYTPDPQSNVSWQLA